VSLIRCAAASFVDVLVVLESGFGEVDEVVVQQIAEREGWSLVVVSEEVEREGRAKMACLARDRGVVCLREVRVDQPGRLISVTLGLGHGGVSATCVVVHGLPVVSGDVNAELARELSRRVSSVARESSAVVVLGDMNAVAPERAEQDRGSAVLHRCDMSPWSVVRTLQSLGWVDVVVSAGLGGVEQSTFHSGARYSRVDAAWVPSVSRSVARVVRCAVPWLWWGRNGDDSDRVPWSDHEPVAVDLLLGVEESEGSVLVSALPRRFSSLSVARRTAFLSSLVERELMATQLSATLQAASSASSVSEIWEVLKREWCVPSTRSASSLVSSRDRVTRARRSCTRARRDEWRTHRCHDGVGDEITTREVESLRRRCRRELLSARWQAWSGAVQRT
jgi:hypothetical protein